MKIPRKSLIFLVVAGAVGLLVLAKSSFFFQLVSINRLIHWVEIARANPWISFGFYFIFVVGVMALPITIFPIIGGVILPFWIAFPMNVLGATAGGWCSFMVTRIFGREAVEPFLRGKFKNWDSFSKKQGFKTVLVLRLLGIPPFIVTNYALGFSAVTHIDFLTATLIGMLPWMAMVTYLAHSLWQAILVGGQAGLAKALTKVMWPLMLMSLTAASMFVLSSFLKKRKQKHAHHSNL